jgi:hypothetical protein
MGHPMATLWLPQPVGMPAHPAGNLYVRLRKIGRAVTPTTLHG